MTRLVICYFNINIAIINKVGATPCGRPLEHAEIIGNMVGANCVRPLENA